MKIHRSLTALILSFGFLFVVMSLLGGGPVPIAQAAPPVSPALAPQATIVTPTRNAVGVPLTESLAISFDEPIDLASVTTGTFVVHGSQSSIFVGVYALSDLSRTIMFDPDRSFFPGEVINASVTTNTLNITGEHAITPTVWQFWAAAYGGTGRFVAHPISPTFGVDNSVGIALGDLDNDGDLDAVVANDGTEPETVWLNDGTGNFAPHSATPSFGAGSSQDVALGDLDNDGDLDAVVANDGTEPETVWLNDGAGNFTPHPTTPSFGASNSTAIALGDIDGDGDLDAIVANYFPDQPETVWLNNGTGVFTPHPSTPSFGTANSTGVALGDLDHDGDLDALVANYNNQPETVWLNDGTGNFTLHLITPSFGASDSQGIALGDLDDDGDLDAVVANYSGEAETVWVNDGIGIFTAHPSTPSFGAGSSTDIVLGDVDSDGDLDAVVANYNNEAETVWLNDGAGSFTPHPAISSFGVGASLGIAQGDVDSDGDLDALVANYLGEAETVWLNQDAVADLLITKTASPEPVVAGTSLFYTITVANQGTLTATNVVVSDTLPPSTTLTTVDQTDDDGGVFGFGGGTYQNTQWLDPRPAVIGDEALTLIDPLAATGVFTSRAIDAGNIVSWTSLAWTPQRPYGKPLPDNRGGEADYALGDANMLGDRVLLHLDEAVGSTNFTDTSGLGNNGMCPAITGESCPTAGAAGRFNQALSFDGSLSQTVTISEAIDPVRYAIELWVNPSVITDTSFILRTDALSGTATNYSQLLGLSGDRFVHLLNDGSTRAITSTTIVTPNTWYHVVGTAESNGDMKLYVNGELQATVDGVGSVWMGGDQYRLGSAYGPIGMARYFSGLLDEVAIYTRTLSAGEVLDHYLRGALRLGFEVRSCDDALCAGEAFGPTIYSEQGNATLGLPSIVLNGVPDNRYFQYRATLIADDPDYAPALHRVTVNPPHPAIYASQGNCAAPAPDQFSCTLGDIAAGGLVTITTEVFVHPSALGIITNTAFVTSTAPITNPLDDVTFVTTTVIARSDLSIHKYDESDLNVVNPGSVITYYLEVYNAGPSTALTPTITDTLPASMFGYAGGSGWTCISGNTITCTRPSLNVYQWSAIQITATAPMTQGLITNTAWISSPVTPDPDPDDNDDIEVTLVVPLADLVIEKTASPDPVDPGAILTYTLSVTNSGPYTATNVIVTDTLPIGFTGYPSGGTDWSCGAPGNIVICSLLTPLTPTFSASFNLTLTAPLSGFLMNLAEVSSAIFDPEPDNNVAIAYTAVRRVADLSIVKRDTPDPVEANSLLTYTLSITNAGPVAAGVLTNTLTFNHPHHIDIPWSGRARGYPSNLHLSSIDGVVQNITLTLNNFSHTYPGDVSALLVGPGGQTVMLMSNASGGADVNNVTLRFNDAGINLPLSGTITSTVVYRPTSYGLTGDLVNPAPAGPYGGSLSIFRGTNPNGLWQLYVYDNVDSDGGLIAGGWSLQLTTATTDTVLVTDTLPIGVNFISATGAGWLCHYTGGQVGCQVDSLPVGPAPDITLVITAPSLGGIITNTASITSTTADFVPGNNTSTITTTVLSVADLSIAKVASSNPVPISTVFTYTLTISNAGPSGNLPVTVTDVLPVSVTYLRHVAPGWTCTVASNIVTCAAPGMALGAQTIQIAVTSPALAGVITNTASITSTAGDPYPLNNTATITTTIADIPISGLVATNDSPTVIGQPTTFQATITAGSNVSFVWNFGDGTAPVSGNPVAHTYALTGTYTAIVTATNSASVLTATTQAVVVPFYKLHLPIVMRNYASAPDLVVSSINVTSNTVQVVIKNQGPADVPIDADHEFWVDLYVNPVPPPTLVNHIWQDGRSTQGVVWGVTVDALPSLRAGGTFTLTLGDAYYWPTLSNFPGGLLPGTPLYVQVDSAHTASAFGGVLENHEIVGLPYNNISGPVLSP
ncbi:hypothetical protein TFLX_04598 [Thermoflexales bacterium]|nr:hypothetical protein TFLX_04598 [Thermoflexales bacterium]